MLLKSSQLSYLFKKKKIPLLFNHFFSDIGTIAPGPSFWLAIKETEPLLQFNCNKVTQNNCHNCSNAQIKKFAPTWPWPPSKSRRKRFVQLWPSFTAEWNEKSQITSCPERTLQLPSSRWFLFSSQERFALSSCATKNHFRKCPQTAGPPGSRFPFCFDAGHYDAPR